MKAGLNIHDLKRMHKILKTEPKPTTEQVAKMFDVSVEYVKENTEAAYEKWRKEAANKRTEETAKEVKQSSVADILLKAAQKAQNS